MKASANSSETVGEILRAKKSSLDSPELEFWQPSDERAKLLILLGGKGWTLICKRGAAIHEHTEASSLLLNYIQLSYQQLLFLRLIINTCMYM